VFRTFTLAFVTFSFVAFHAVTPAGAAEPDPVEVPGSGWYAVMPETGAVFVPDVTGVPPAGSDFVVPMLLDPC
jgi:hypothetical protein